MRHALATTLLLSMPSATLSFHAPEPGKIRGNHDSSAVRSGSPTLVLGASSALARQSELAPGSKPALGTVLQALQRAAAHPDLRHIAGATLQAGGLGASADAASQAMHALPVDFAHVKAMAICAAILSGACNAAWLMTLEASVPGSSTRAVCLKTAADYAIAGTLANSAYIAFVPMLTCLFAGGTFADSLATGGWTPDAFRDVMLLELCTFAPYNLVAFQMVPPKLRPLSAAAVSAFCTIALSSITLGFHL